MSDNDRTSPPRRDLTRWFLGAFVLLAGWLFILWQNKFYVTAPVVFVCLGYLAVLAAVVTLWRTGAVAADDSLDDEVDEAVWGRSLGARGELEREKRILLKAIKEAEFDREMDKLSPKDAGEMIAFYRARAIEVIKEIDRLDSASAGTVREQIERELKARLELEGKVKKPRSAGRKSEAATSDHTATPDRTSAPAEAGAEAPDAAASGEPSSADDDALEARKAVP